MSDEKYIKHLELVQGVINRMAHCSFLIKGWSVTLVSALFALAAKDSDPRFSVLAYFPAIMFWLLDGFFVDQERRFRKLYEGLILPGHSIPEFCLDTSAVEQPKHPWAEATLSPTLLLFHGAILLTILIVMLFLTFFSSTPTPPTS